MLSLFLYRFFFPFRFLLRFLFRFQFLFLFLLQFLFRIPDSGFRFPAFPDVRSNDNFISNSIVGNDSFLRGYSIYYSQYKLSCIYWVCRSNVNPTFKRRVFELEDSSGNPSPLIVLQYVFDGDPSSMEVKPHGRSKKNPRPFFTTASGTRIKMSQQASSSVGPSSIYDQLYQEAGDVLSRKASADVPRSIDQVKYEPKKLRNQHEKD